MKNTFIVAVLNILTLSLICGCEAPTVVSKPEAPSPWIKENNVVFAVRLPDSGMGVAMTQMVRQGDRKYLAGQYKLTHSPNVIERGTVYLDTEAGVEIRKPAALMVQGKLYAIPFIVSTQGTGIFHYVGLFAVNAGGKQSTHRSSFLLGDRVQDIRLSDAGRAIKISLLQHSPEQSYAETPSEAATVNLYIEDDMTLRPYIGMHPSWDRDNDGINDCEADGTCDDSQDYTIARDFN